MPRADVLGVTESSWGFPRERLWDTYGNKRIREAREEASRRSGRGLQIRPLMLHSADP